MKKTLFTLAFTSILLVGCTSTKQTSTVSIFASTSPIETSLDLTKVKDDKVPVMINPGKFREEKVTYKLPRVVQGTYSVSDFGKYIDNFQALNYKGEVMPSRKIDTNSWEISNATNLDKITYDVNDTFDIETTGGIGGETPFSPCGTNIEDTNYVLNLHGFIGYFDALKNNQYKIDVTAPTNFVRTSALQETGKKTSEDGAITTSSYFAPRYFDVTDNPMFFGELDVEEFEVGDIKIVLSIYSPNEVHKAADIKKVVEKMMQAQKAYLGDVNSTARYDIYLYLSEGTQTSPMGYGALEHHTSTVVVLPEAMSADELAESMIDIVSHEFFHIVTPLSVHSEDVHYFDYDQPTFSKHLWMYEGVTEYFANLFQIDQQLISEDDFYSRIMSKINYASNMNDTMSFTKMSENILEEPYAEQYVNVYQKGALIGMCIDILMREESKGNRGILSLMKELSSKYGKNKPFVDDALIAEITMMTYPSVGQFLNTHVVGTKPIDYKQFFEKVGLSFDREKVETSYLANAQSYIIGFDQEKEQIIFNSFVEDNSFWAENGVLSGDAIKFINGQELTKASAQQIIEGVYAWQPGQDVTVTLDRDGKEIVIKTKLTKSYTNSRTLKKNPNPTPTQIALKNAWIKS